MIAWLRCLQPHVLITHLVEREHEMSDEQELLLKSKRVMLTALMHSSLLHHWQKGPARFTTVIPGDFLFCGQEVITFEERTPGTAASFALGKGKERSVPVLDLFCES